MQFPAVVKLPNRTGQAPSFLRETALAEEVVEEEEELEAAEEELEAEEEMESEEVVVVVSVEVRNCFLSFFLSFRLLLFFFIINRY